MSSTTAPRGASLRSASPVKRALAAVLVLLAVALLALLVTATYGLNSEYDLAAGGVKPMDALIVLLLGCLALLLLLAARRQVGASRPSTTVLAVTVLAVFAGGAAAGTALGAAAHDRRTATVATACSPADLELLAAVEFSGLRDGPRGDPGGGCVLHLFSDTEASTAVADLEAGLQRDGWQPAGPRGDAPALERDGAVLTLTTVPDDKTAEILLTLR